MTNYRLANDDEMPKIYEAYDITNPMGWPVVIAEDKGKIKGVLGTLDDEDFIISGPFFAENGIVMIRLVKAYRNVMRLLGANKYYFFVEKSNERWLKQVRRLKMMVEREDMEQEDLVWFETYIDYPYGIKYQFPSEVH